MQLEDDGPGDNGPGEEWEDPIVAEVRRAREQILARFEHDIGAYTAHIIAIQEEKKRRGFQYASPRARRPEGSTQPPAHR